MVLTTHPVSGTNERFAFGSQVTAYEIGGLPQGEHAVIAEFPDQGWRILRWNAAMAWKLDRKLYQPRCRRSGVARAVAHYRLIDWERSDRAQP